MPEDIDLDEVQFNAPQFSDNAPESEGEAPWGRKLDGSPKKRPGRAPGAPKPILNRPATSPGRSRGKADYRSGINGVFQLIATPLTIIGAQKNNVPLIADGAALSLHGEGIASAVNDLAHEDARVAAVLDRILSVGPYGALIGSVLPLVAQILRNHEIGPVEMTQGMGARSPEKLLETLMPAA